MSALSPMPAPDPGHDLVYAITTARKVRDARLGRALTRLCGYVADAASALVRWIGDAQRADRSRRVLLDLDERQLRDVGLTRDDVLREADALRPLSMLLANGITASTGAARQRREHGDGSW